MYACMYACIYVCLFVVVACREKRMCTLCTHAHIYTYYLPVCVHHVCTYTHIYLYAYLTRKHEANTSRESHSLALVLQYFPRSIAQILSYTLNRSFQTSPDQSGALETGSKHCALCVSDTYVYTQVYTRLFKLTRTENRLCASCSSYLLL